MGGWGGGGGCGPLMGCGVGGGGPEVVAVEKSVDNASKGFRMCLVLSLD